MKSLFIAILVLGGGALCHATEKIHTIVDDGWQGIHGWHFSGRLTEVHRPPAAKTGGWSALYRNTRLLFASGEEGLVTFHAGDNEWTLRTDEHGYWELAGNQPLGLSPGWHEIESAPLASSPAGFLVVDPRNSVAIISDIDDTILVTGVLDKALLLKNSLTVPPEQREAVPGMAELYRNLLGKNPAPEASAVFYLSSSPRQLTDNLRRFLSAAGFPRGVLQLRDPSREKSDSASNHEVFKLRHIEAICAAFPKLRFTLFGDDGEYDPEIYAEVKKRHPDQVAAIWIRHLNPDKNRRTFPDEGNVRELLP